MDKVYLGESNRRKTSPCSSPSLLYTHQMTILNLEWLLISTPHSPRKLRRRALVSISIHRSLLGVSPAAQRLVIFCSAGSSSSLLEEASNDLQLFQFSSSSSPLKPLPISSIGGSDVFIKGLEERLQPDKPSLKILVRDLLKSKDWGSIAALSEDIKSSLVFPDKATCSRLVGACIRARKFKIAESLLGVFESKQEIAVATFGAALRGYNRVHMYSSTVLLHKRMTTIGVSLDDGCYCWVMDAYRKLGNIDEVTALFEEYQSRKLGSSSSSSSVYSAQIYLIFCDSLGRAGRAFEALRYFRNMIDGGASPNPSFYASLVCSFAGIKEAQVAEDLFEEAKAKGMMKDPAVFLKLVLMYVELGSLRKTIEVVKVMKEMGIGVSDCVFCAVVNGYAKKEGLSGSVKAYDELISLGCVPGQVTYASVINVYCRLGLFTKAEKFFEEMLSRGFDKCVVAYSNMVSMYGKAGRIRDAMRLLAKMKEKGCEPNVWVYNSLIDMHGRIMNVRQVEKLWKEMKRKKIKPDKVSYTSIIGAYSKTKEFKECIKLYREFKMNRGKIDRAMAGIMVGVFSKTSRISELIKLLQDAKVEGIQLDERLYMSSLNALRDAGLQVQVRWFRESFAYVKAERRSLKE